MIQNLDFALGFFITIIFLASVVVILTLIYLSHPKLRTPIVKKETSQAKTAKPKEEHLIVDKDHVVQPENQDTIVDDKAPAKESKETRIPETPVNEAKSAVNTKAESPKLATEDKKNTGNEALKAVPDSNNPPNANPPLSQAEIDLKSKPNPETPPVKDNPPPVTSLNVPVAQGQLAPVTAGGVEKTSLEVKSEEASKVAQPETGNQTQSPSINLIKENEGKKPMEDKPVEDPPQDAKSDGDFGDLFAEEMEETEASRLAKELKDVDTADILQTSQSLVSQFKRKKNSLVD
jgi:hypothetical protein